MAELPTFNRNDASSNLRRSHQTWVECELVIVLRRPMSEVRILHPQLLMRVSSGVERVKRRFRLPNPSLMDG